MTSNPQAEPFDEPGEASAEEGHVVLDGPDGVAITPTADAAVKTGQRLVDAGQEARKQLSENSKDNN